MNHNQELQLSDVEETGLLTLYCRAAESLSKDPIIDDRKAVEIVKKLDPLLCTSKSRLLRDLADRKIDHRLVVHIALRARYYDQCAQNFISRNPDGMVVNLGCGMDTRFFRMDDGKVRLLDVDFEEMIRSKKKLLDENDRYRMLGCSLLNNRWMDAVDRMGNAPVIFLAEGVFMYLDGGDVQRLVLEMQKRFPGSELVCEVTNAKWIKLASYKMQKRFKLGGGADFRFGVANCREMEGWNEGIKFLNQWTYFDTRHRKLGLMRWMGKSDFFRNAQYTVSYQLN